MSSSFSPFKKISKTFSNIKLGVIVATMVLVVSSVLTFVTFTMSIKQSDLVNHTREVEGALEKLLSVAKDGETAVRGYLLTHEKIFLQPYYGAKQDLPDNLDYVQALTIDNDYQQKTLIRVQALFKERFNSLDSLALLFEAGKLTEEKKLVFMNHGREVMDELRFEVIKMQNVENDLYTERNTEAKLYTQRARTIITIFSLTSLIIIIVTFYILSKSQNEIAKRELKYRHIFEQSMDIIFQLDKSLKIIEINPAISAHLGYEPDELNNLDLATLFRGEENKMAIERTIKNGSSISNMEVVLLHKDGRNISFIFNLYADITNKVFQGSLINITERKRMEREKIALERFAGIGKIARIIAHEVRNPLTNINLSVETLKSESDQADLNDYLEIIEKNSKRINNLITELLYTTKVSEIHSSKVQVNRLLDETIELASDRIKLKGIRLIKEYDSTTCEVEGDEQQLKMAFLNIIINAIEAMENEENILTITTKTTSIKCQIIITDNGKGISEIDREKIFDPFFSTKKSGTGLGLATTQNIVLLHSGLIEVESQPDKGTKFIITLNIA